MNSININPEKYKNPKREGLNSLNDCINFYEKLIELCQSLPYIINLDNFPKENIKNLFSFLYSFYKE